MSTRIIDIDAWQASTDMILPRAGGLHPPMSVLASWPRANYIDPVTRDWTGPGIVTAFAILACLMYGARMWARLFVAKNAGLDDVLMTFAMLPLLGLIISILLGITKYGFQWHAWDQTPKTLITTREIALAIELNYMVSTTFIKISILCFYRRLSRGSISKLFVYCVWATILFVICFFISFFFAIMFTCASIKDFTHIFDFVYRFTHHIKCNNEGAIIVSVAVLSTIQDFFICALPIFLVWNLQVPRRQKAALIGVFAVGLVTCVCGMMRAYYAVYVYYYTYDITWIAFYGWVWTGLEAELAVMCASAPALKVFFRRYFSIGSTRSQYNFSKRSGQRARNGKGNAVRTAAAIPRPSPSNNPGRWDTPVPLDRIHISRDITVESEVAPFSRCASIGHISDASTRNLTSPIPEKDAFTSKWATESERADDIGLGLQSYGKRYPDQDDDIECMAGMAR